MRFPGFSDEWKTTKLKTYVVENKERNTKGKFSKEQVLSVSGDKGIVNQIQLLGRSYAGQSVLPYHVVHHNDIVYTKSPLSDFPYGIVKMNRGLDGIVSTLYAVYSVLDSAHPSFIEYYFASKHRTNRYFKPIVRIGAKHDMKIGNSEVLANEVTFPNIDEQINISKFLELIDERIGTQNKIIEDLKKLKSAISAKLFDGHHVSDISNGWKVVRLGDITEKFSHRNKNSDSYPMFSVTNTSGFSPQYEVFEGKEIKDEDISIYKIIHKGDFAYNPARINVGSIGRYDEEEPCMISSLYVCFRPTAQVDSDWLLYYLQSAKKIYQYGIFGEGGVRIYLFYPNFSRIEALLPPLTVQKEIASILKSFNRKIKLEELLLSNYQKQKKFLLAQMFT